MKIAVIVPCRNEEANISECINAIYNSVIPENFEISVFVVDGRSNDNTLSIIEELKSKFKSLNVVVNEKQLTPYAFNLGIYAGKGSDYFQIVGARQILDTNYIAKAVADLENDNSIWCVGGRVENVFLNDTGRVIAKAMGTSFGMGLGNFRTIEKSGFVDTVGTPMYPYWVFEKIGFFDENLIRNQDDDFNFRVTNAGGKIYYDHEISLKYYVRGNFKGLWKQFFQYGYWKVYVNKKHKAVTTLRQLVPPLFVIYLAMLILTSFFSISVAGVFGLPFVVYVAMAVYFALKASEKDKEIKFWEVFKTFPILHVSYGLGYLKGIWTFLILNQRPSDKQKELSR
jgi:GT2 family glycosyltransferase